MFYKLTRMHLENGVVQRIIYYYRTMPSIVYYMTALGRIINELPVYYS